MPAIVSLQDVVEAMDLPNPDWESYLNPESGEIVTVTDEDRYALENFDSDDRSDWMAEDLPRKREAVESDRYLHLPDSFDIHEWGMMERFCRSVEDSSARERLLDAIHGRGAFRRFRRVAEAIGLRARWFAYRDDAYERIAREWLKANHIPYR